MPIFEVDGQQFEVEDKYVSDFAKEYPNAVTKVDSEEAIYEVSASDYPAYLDTQRAPRRVVPEKTTIPGSHAKPYQIYLQKLMKHKHEVMLMELLFLYQHFHLN